MSPRTLCCLACLLALLGAVGPALAAAPAESGRPAFRATFDATAEYLRIKRGTRHGLRNDYLGPEATRGELRDANDLLVGEFVTVHADDFEAIVRIVSLAEGRSIADIEHVAIPSLSIECLKFSREDSRAYFRIDKGSDDLPSDVLKRAAKGRLFDSKGKVAAIYRVVAVGARESLGVVTQFEQGFFAQDIEKGDITGYFDQMLQSSGIANLTPANLVMVLIGLLFIYLAIAKDYEPLLLVPIGFGILIGNIPLPLSIFNSVSLYMIDPVTHEYTFNTGGNSVLGMIYFGVRTGLFPPLIFLGIGALTDFSALLSRPKSLLLGAAAQIGIFATFIGALWLGFSPQSAAAIGIIGGADGPTAIFTSSRLAPSLIGPIAIAAYSYMAMVPIIQPPIMKLLTTREERLIRMKPGRKVSQLEKIAFPVMGLLVTCLIAPGGLPLLGMLFFGNLLKESGVTGRLAKTASSALLDICTILLGVAVGASTSAQVFLNTRSVLIFVLGCLAFGCATAGGVLFAKLMNLFSKEKVNPLIGAAGVSAVPDSARVAHQVGQAEDPGNFLLQHAMGPNVAGVIGSAIAAGIFLGLF
ncbi:MAG TPA: sodium ion-translocating decarboxylase subunit beta [Thermoanaerobaculaceae bacterium]|nr:sodium ion-translocating decarboxylase subunit beta [Thermoanaerobaculaceae bacterium]HRS14839.1 sodium ion-translocating decarboxylase subunit beta [Thermoanaerobaculaceae bacterium]